MGPTVPQQTQLTSLSSLRTVWLFIHCDDLTNTKEGQQSLPQNTYACLSIEHYFENLVVYYLENRS